MYTPTGFAVGFFSCLYVCLPACEILGEAEIPGAALIGTKVNFHQIKEEASGSFSYVASISCSSARLRESSPPHLICSFTWACGCVYTIALHPRLCQESTVSRSSIDSRSDSKVDAYLNSYRLTSPNNEVFTLPITMLRLWDIRGGLYASTASHTN